MALEIYVDDLDTFETLVPDDWLNHDAALLSTGVYLGFRAPCIREATTPADHGFAFKARNGAGADG